MKAYMIVTNDEYEFPVAHDLFGAKAAAEYLGMAVSTFRQCICLNTWSKKAKYKAVIDDEATVRLQTQHKAEMDAHWRYKRAFDPAYRERRHRYDRERWRKRHERNTELYSQWPGQDGTASQCAGHPDRTDETV